MHKLSNWFIQIRLIFYVSGEIPRCKPIEILGRLKYLLLLKKCAIISNCPLITILLTSDYHIIELLLYWLDSILFFMIMIGLLCAWAFRNYWFWFIYGPWQFVVCFSIENNRLGLAHKSILISIVLINLGLNPWIFN